MRQGKPTVADIGSGKDQQKVGERQPLAVSAGDVDGPKRYLGVVEMLEKDKNPQQPEVNGHGWWGRWLELILWGDEIDAALGNVRDSDNPDLL